MRSSSSGDTTASLYSLFAISLLYFWLSLFALRQALTTVWRSREKERRRKKRGGSSTRGNGDLSLVLPELNLYLPFHFATFCHSTIRWVLLVLAYFTDESHKSKATAMACDTLCELRRMVLGDIPGFIFVGIYVWLCARMQQIFAKYNFGARQIIGVSEPQSDAKGLRKCCRYLACTQATKRAILSGALFSTSLHGSHMVLERKCIYIVSSDYQQHGTPSF